MIFKKQKEKLINEGQSDSVQNRTEDNETRAGPTKPIIKGKKATLAKRALSLHFTLTAASEDFAFVIITAHHNCPNSPKLKIFNWELNKTDRSSKHIHLRSLLDNFAYIFKTANQNY